MLDLTLKVAFMLIMLLHWHTTLIKDDASFKKKLEVKLEFNTW